ncbi:MAG: bifunctional DNA primase/polymerase [Gemmataceae bacterium]|nr:bifunctional DNA primase/polymerase [Gemmataceae bacterium]
MGWPLFPCSNRDKAPLVAGGFKAATADIGQLKAWHERFPGCAWAVATSAERGVVDVDPRHGGDATLAALVATHGPLPLTPRVRTGGGGWHYWFRFPPGTGSKANAYGPGIDRKADGGYVVVPRSRIDIPEHDGREYAWEVRPWEAVIAEAPVWLVDVKPTPKAGSPEADPWVVREADGDDLLTHPGSPEGTRRHTLCRLVGVHLARGDSEPSILAMAEAWAGRCTPPFTDWHKHAVGLMAKDAAKGVRLTTPLPLRPSPAKPSAIRPSPIVEYRDDSLVPPEGRKEVTNSGAGGEPGPEGVSYFLPLSPEPEPKTVEPELVTSFPACGPGIESGAGGGLSSDWPTLPPEARHGLFGEMLHAVERETESDPAAVLLGFLTCFGSIVGRGAWVQVGADQHFPCLFVGIVGRTSDAKGVAWGSAKWPFSKADPAWAKACVCHGVGSGQGLIERVRDERRCVNVGKDGTVKETVIPAAPDKRCLVRLDELAVCLKVQRSESSTLGETLLTVWGGEPLEVPNRGDNALSASGYAVSVYGDTQPGTLRKLLEKGTEGFSGWMNRFLWAAVRSELDLPGGGNILVLEPFVKPLADALAFAKQAGEVRRDADAERLWHEVYGTLKRSGDTVPHTDRARPYVVRLSLLYALADRSPVIRVEHLRAALAVFAYCRESARLIFGGKPVAVPDPLWLKLLNLIADQPGILRADLTRAVKNAAKAEAVGDALAKLVAAGKAYATVEQNPNGGPKAERWWPGVRAGGGGDGVSRADDNTLTPLSHEEADVWAVRPEAVADGDGTSREAGKEVTNSPGDADPWVVRAENAGKEVTNSASPSAAGELVTSFLVTDAAGEGKPGPGIPGAVPPAPESVGAGGVVNRSPPARFAHEPEGGFGPTGKPAPPPWPLPTWDVQRNADGKPVWHGQVLQTVPTVYADQPPEEMPEKWPGESDTAHFARCLGFDPMELADVEAG